MSTALSVRNLSKQYQTGFKALDGVSLDIRAGEVFSLLGPNGAGKTTLIGAICGLVRPTTGEIEVFGNDHILQYRNARSKIGLVPQELTVDNFSTPWYSVSFSRGLFGYAPNPGYIESLLKRLSLWDKKDTQIRYLSGGMKRRVMIAKALSHEPKLLFLDEPTAGVDVTLRKSMWEQMRELSDVGVTIFLTTHYIEEAEEMSDRIGIINHGKLIVTEDKSTLIKKLGRCELSLHLSKKLDEVPAALKKFDLKLSDDGCELVFSYKSSKQRFGISELLDAVRECGVHYDDLDTRQSSLEQIFVELVKGDA